MQKTLLVIEGPTAVGKTDFAISVAQHFTTEILSADSRQVYSEMMIGTARPSITEWQGITHHLLGHVSIHTPYSVADFAKDAHEKLKQLFINYDLVILVGGSGLYLDAVCNGLDDLPDSNPKFKSELMQRLETEGIVKLQELLFTLDPEQYSQMDIQNPHRLVRAIEVCLLSGKKFSDLKSGKKAQHAFRIVKVGLELERAELYKRINTRVELMMQKGLLKEATALFEHRHLKALKTVGYTELFDYLENKISLDSAIELIQQNTRRYAKRQMTWFRRDSEIAWMDASDWGNAHLKIDKLLA